MYLLGTSHQVFQGKMHFYGSPEAVAVPVPVSTGQRPRAEVPVARATCTEAPYGKALCTVSRHQQRLEPLGIAVRPFRHTSNRDGGWTGTGDNISVDVGCARMPRSVFEFRGQKSIYYIFFFFRTNLSVFFLLSSYTINYIAIWRLKKMSNFIFLV